MINCPRSASTTQKFVNLLLIISLLFGCSTFTPVAPEPDTIVQMIQPGDKVRIITRDGRKEKFVVEEVTEFSLHGEGIVIQMDEIATIEIVVLSDARTSGLIVGIAITVIVLLSFLISYAAVATPG